MIQIFLKRIAIFVVVLVILSIGGFFGYIILNSHEGFNITVQNQTNVDIKGLKFTYFHITRDISIPTIPANSSYKFNITPKEQFGENTMSLYYYDKRSTKHTENVVGYFEKGSGGEVLIKVLSLTQTGKLNLEIEAKTY